MEKNRYKVTIKQHGKYTDSIEGFSAVSNRKDEKEEG